MLPQRGPYKCRRIGPVLDVNASPHQHVQGVHGAHMAEHALPNGGEAREDAAVEIERDVV